MPLSYANRLPCLAPIVLAVFMTLVTTPAWAQDTRIGVVDVDRLFTDTAAAKAITEQMTLVRNDILAKIQKHNDDLEAKQKELPQLAPESERAIELQRQIVIVQGQKQAEEQFGEARMSAMVMQGNLRVLNLVKRAVTDVAQQKQLGLVLRKAPPLPANVGRNARDTQDRIAQQVALYAAPEYDITADVLTRMDELYRTDPQAGQGGPPPATRPAAGDAGSNQ